MAETTSLLRALAYLKRGFSVIPVPRPDATHDGKVPAIAWRDYQTRRPTEAELRAWFRTEQNIAILTGAISDLVAVDLDSREALRWWARHRPYTPWQTQTSRGFHVFYRHPGPRVPNRAKLQTRDGQMAIDVRGDGGFVIAPGSLHASGTTYREAGDWSVPRASVPRFWPGWIARPQAAAQAPHSRPAVRPSGDLSERARRYLAAVPQPEIGAGSDAATLYAACRLVRGFGLDSADAEALLWEWAGGRPGWTREWIAQKVKHAVRYGTESIGSLA